MKAKHPIQNLYIDEHRIIRFKKNEIVCFLLDNGKFDLNNLSMMNFSKEDWEQFMQLIGYSLSGFAELSTVTDKTYYRADRKAKKLREELNKNV